MVKFYKKTFIFIILCLILECATEKKRTKIVIEKSSQTPPLWVGKEKWEDNEYIFFVSKYTIYTNPVEGLRKAKQKLIEKINNEIKKGLKSEFKEKIEEIDYADWIEKIKDKFINGTLNLLDFNNLIPDDTYYEKIKENIVYYNCYVYKALSKSAINNKKLEMIDALISEYNKSIDIKKFLKKLKEKYKCR